MTRLKDWPMDPAKWPTGPLRWVERHKNLILQTWVWCEYTDEYMEAEKPGAPGEYCWVDVPLEEE